MSEPALPVTYSHTDMKIRQHALYATVVVKDANGQLWEFPAASFYFDLKPYEPDTSGGKP